jgi:ketosteroid isomerase-like protein
MKNGFKKVFTAVLLTGLFYTIGLSQEKEKIKPLDDLIQNEKNFAKTCLEKGVSVSFLAYLDDNSLVFRPEPVNGKELYTTDKDSSSRLFWGPDYAEVSGYGDLGFTSGPWEYSANKSDSPIAFGHFVSIWHKTDEKTWKLLIDVGVPHKKLDVNIKNVAWHQNDPEIKDLPYNKFIGEKNKLLETEHSFSNEALEKGFPAAFSNFVSDNVRVLRRGLFPMTDKNEIKEALSKEDRKCSWEPIESNIALSGDLGYTYGYIQYKKENDDKVKNDSSSYVRIWRKVQDGNFKIALDIVLPITKKK